MGVPILEKVKDFQSNWKSRLQRSIKSPIFLAKLLGIVIPLLVLLYVVYINVLPFGLSRTYVIDVGSENDTKPSEFYLEPSKDLSDKIISESGATSRQLNGQAIAIFDPQDLLNQAEITVETKNDNIKIIQPYIQFNTSSVNWDYNWDFINGVPKALVNYGAFPFDGKVYLDGQSHIEFASSSNVLEEGAFTIYAEWNPADSSNDFQEIVGHFNWELLQDSNKVKFMIGRTDDKNGPFYSVEYPIRNKVEFFGSKHSAIAIYSPDQTNGNVYIELYIDNKFANRVYLGKRVIWKDYNGNKNITIGKSQHGAATFFKGFLNRINITTKNVLTDQAKVTFKSSDKQIKIPLITNTTTTLENVFLYVHQR